MNRAIILVAGLVMALPASADELSDLKAELEEQGRINAELGAIRQEQAELNHRLKGSTARGVTEGYGGRPLGTTVAEERRLQRVDEIRAREDGQRMFVLENRARAIYGRQRQAAEAQRRADAEASFQRSLETYDQVLESMRSYSSKPLPQSDYEPPPSRIQMPTVEEYVQQKRAEAPQGFGSMRSSPRPVVFPDSSPDFSQSNVPYTPFPGPPQRSPVEAFSEGWAIGGEIGDKLLAARDRSKREREEKEAFQRYVNEMEEPSPAPSNPFDAIPATGKDFETYAELAGAAAREAIHHAKEAQIAAARATRAAAEVEKTAAAYAHLPEIRNLLDTVDSAANGATGFSESVTKFAAQVMLLNNQVQTLAREDVLGARLLAAGARLGTQQASELASLAKEDAELAASAAQVLPLYVGYLDED